MKRISVMVLAVALTGCGTSSVTTEVIKHEEVIVADEVIPVVTSTISQLCYQVHVGKNEQSRSLLVFNSVDPDSLDCKHYALQGLINDKQR